MVKKWAVEWKSEWKSKPVASAWRHDSALSSLRTAGSDDL